MYHSSALVWIWSLITDRVIEERKQFSRWKQVTFFTIIPRTAWCEHSSSSSIFLINCLLTGKWNKWTHFSLDQLIRESCIMLWWSVSGFWWSLFRLDHDRQQYWRRAEYYHGYNKKENERKWQNPQEFSSRFILLPCFWFILPPCEHNATGDSVTDTLWLTWNRYLLLPQKPDCALELLDRVLRAWNSIIWYFIASFSTVICGQEKDAWQLLERDFFFMSQSVRVLTFHNKKYISRTDREIFGKWYDSTRGRTKRTSLQRDVCRWNRRRVKRTQEEDTKHLQEMARAASWWVIRSQMDVTQTGPECVYTAKYGVWTWDELMMMIIAMREMTTRKMGPEERK